ncbi:MAG: ParB/RepB/Spo0J family partition protein [Erysipelotrichaceae bacterium]|nr:ParB/RepB/Spo0J family partition protein [Erysipelotrichaceae bacterium]MDY5253006.1 ParB/RepB/Spo0J family partition protein [Erysipelotrichaceae bacterium]
MTKKAKRPALGQGLENIFGDGIEDLISNIEESSSLQSASEIAIDSIRPNPYQPRKIFDEKALEELTASIVEHGIFTPLLLRQSVQGYEIIAGERRFRAAKKAGLDHVPAIIVDFNDEQMMEIAILENVQREDLNAIEEANAYKNLMDRLGYTQELLAKRVGKSREYCANILRLLKLPLEVQDMVSKGQLALGHVRPLITLDDEDKIIELAQKIVAQKMSVREVERLIKEMNEEKPVKKVKVKDPNLANVEAYMESRLQTKVTVENKKITIKYADVNDLNRILELLNCIEE